MFCSSQWYPSQTILTFRCDQFAFCVTSFIPKALSLRWLRLSLRALFTIRRLYCNKAALMLQLQYMDIKSKKYIEIRSRQWNWYIFLLQGWNHDAFVVDPFCTIARLNWKCRVFFLFACLQELCCAGELYFNSYTRKHKISTLYSVLYARINDVLVSLLYFRQSYLIVLFACLMLILSETYGKTLHECLVMLVRSGLIVLAYYLLIC